MWNFCKEACEPKLQKITKTMIFFENQTKYHFFVGNSVGKQLKGNQMKDSFCYAEIFIAGFPQN